MCYCGCPSLSLSSLKDGVSFEVRRYDGAKYATVSSEGRTFDQVTGELVRKLLMYIGGSNEQGKPTRNQKNSCDASVLRNGFTF